MKKQWYEEEEMEDEKDEPDEEDEDDSNPNPTLTMKQYHLDLDHRLFWQTRQKRL